MALKVWLPLIKDYNNQGTFINNPTNTGATVSTSGPLGGSYSFDGTNDKIQTAYPSAETDMTICLWVTFTKLNVHLIDMRSKTGEAGYQPMYVGTSGIQVGGSNSTYPYINFVPSLNTWYHLCVVYSADTTKLYVNGSYYGQATGSKGYNFNRDMEVHLGSRCNGLNYFGGSISDFRIYNEVLSDYQIKNIAQGLLLHYTMPCKDTYLVGETISDSSGFNRESTIYGSTWGLVSFVKAYHYGRRWSTAVDGGYSSAPSPSANTKTISFWLQVTKTASTVFFADYKSKLAFGFNSSQYIIASCDSLNTKMFDSARFVSGIMHHIVLRKNEDGSDIDLFIDGAQVTTRYSGNYWTHSTDTLMIGRRSTGTPMSNATFCDFRMYATRLSDDDIVDLYRTSLKQFSNGKSSPYVLYEDAIGKVQITKGGLLINDCFVESNTGNKFKSTQVISDEFIER